MTLRASKMTFLHFWLESIGLLEFLKTFFTSIMSIMLEPMPTKVHSKIVQLFTVSLDIGC